jgi:hypothetical protein
MRRNVYLSIMRRRLRPGRGSSQDFLRSREGIHVPRLSDLLGDCPFVVVGGVATALYMPMRATKDVDVLIHAGDAQAARGALVASGATPVGPLRISGQLGLTGQSWRLPDGSELDVLESTQEWARLAVAKPTFDSGGTPVISLPYLVLMKLDASRAVDLGDLERMLGVTSPAVLDETRGAITRFLPSLVEDFDSIVQLAVLSTESSIPAAPTDVGEVGQVRVREHSRRGRVIREHWRRNPGAT